MILNDIGNMHVVDRNEVSRFRTRMKKVAPPPPGAQPALPNGGGGDCPRRLAVPYRQPMSCIPGEDCAFDELLEGRMELQVILPDNKSVRMTVDRRTPMMDLLVHVASSNKISAGGHTIKVLSEEQHSILYKPNTPIGSLDVNTVYVVPKTVSDVPVKRMPKLANQPFEQTFRIQVNLPRNQRMVLRVSPRITLADLKRQICNEKELDHNSHHLVHPTQPDTLLDLNTTLDIYGCAEISLLSNSGLRESIHSLSTQLIAYPRALEEEKKKKGILRLFSKKKKESQVENSSNGIGGSRPISPTRPAQSVKQSSKRKPAPAPPLVIQSSSSRPESEISAKTDELGSTVSHSRHSSDSSGYHEPSVFSDCSENKSPEASIVHCGNAIISSDTTFCKEVPDNLRTVPSASIISAAASRKRKAPQPPAPALPEVETPEDQSLSEITAAGADSGGPDEGELEREVRASESLELDALQQESEALEYFENVLLQEEEESDSCDVLDMSGEAKGDDVAGLTELDAPRRRVDDDALKSSEPIFESSLSTNLYSSEVTETSKPEDIPESEKAPSDSDYYADLSSTNTDTSDTPPVPLNKDILLRENAEIQFAQIKSALIESTISETIVESIDSENDTAETPLVPKNDLCPISEPAASAETFKSKIEPEAPQNPTMENNSTATMSPMMQKKLVNFAMGCYKNEVEDIYTDVSPSVDHTTKEKHAARTEFVIEAIVHEVPTGCDKQSPQIEIVPFEDRRPTDFPTVPDNTKGHVQKLCTELSGMSTLPLTGRSSSLYNLSPQVKANQGRPILESTELRNSSESLKRAQSVRNVVLPEEKSDFIHEQKRLHEEYLKLQAQFVSWQKQLLNNQTLLQTEHIVPQMSFPAFEQYKVELDDLPVALKESSYGDEVKTRSLPRPKSRPLSVKELNRSDTPPPPHHQIKHKSKSEETIDPSPSFKREKAVMSDSGISTEETSDQSNVASDLTEETSDTVPTSKSQTLPRLVSKPANTPMTDATKTVTLNRQTRPKSQIVSVTIGSWQQRNMTAPDISSASVASSRSIFQSLQNIPRERNVMTSTIPPQKNRAEVSSSDEDKLDHSKTIHTNGKLTSEDTIVKRAPNSTESQQPKDKVEKASSKISESSKQRTKPEQKSQSVSAEKAKPSKPLIRLSSMKDEPHPPALHVLKKWPLPEINEKESPVKPSKEQASFWEEIAAGAKRPTGRTQEKVTRAEVDLRKHRGAKSDSSKSTKSKDSDEGAIKVHVTKVDITAATTTTTNNKVKEESYKSKVEVKNKAVVRPSTLQTKSTALLQENPMPFNAELKNVLSKRASMAATPIAGEPVEPTYAEAKDSRVERKKIQTSAQNGNSPPPPPPPPVSTMPTIPPAAPIPKSSQLLMGRKVSGSATLPKQANSQPKAAPREELMLEIRGFGGRQALRKAPSTQPGWHLKVYGSTSAVNS